MNGSFAPRVSAHGRLTARRDPAPQQRPGRAREAVGARCYFPIARHSSRPGYPSSLNHDAPTMRRSPTQSMTFALVSVVGHGPHVASRARTGKLSQPVRRRQGALNVLGLVPISSVFDTAQGPGATAQESADLHGALAEGISVHHLGEGCLASMPKRDRPGDPSCSRIRARTVVLTSRIPLRPIVEPSAFPTASLARLLDQSDQRLLPNHPWLAPRG